MPAGGGGYEKVPCLIVRPKIKKEKKKLPFRSTEHFRFTEGHSSRRRLRKASRFWKFDVQCPAVRNRIGSQDDIKGERRRDGDSGEREGGGERIGIGERGTSDSGRLSRRGARLEWPRHCLLISLKGERYVAYMCTRCAPDATARRARSATTVMSSGGETAATTMTAAAAAAATTAVAVAPPDTLHDYRPPYWSAASVPLPPPLSLSLSSFHH